MAGVVYLIRNLVNNKVYVGSTNNLTKRISTHFRNLNNGSHHSKHLQAAYNIDGKQNFIIEPIMKLNSTVDLRELEADCIAVYRSLDPDFGYNVSERTSHPCISGRFGEAAPSRKLSEVQVDEIRNRALTEKFVDLAKEFNVSHATISNVVSGKRWNKNKILTNFTSRSHRNRILSEDQVREIRVKLQKLSCKKIAEEYGVSPCTVRDIRTGRSWNWLI